ncbi:MAG: RraA family protein [Pseudomonadota bacterium]
MSGEVVLPELTARLHKLYSAAVHDVMRGRGFENFVLPRDIRPLEEGKKLAGPVFTVEGKSGKGFDEHETLLEWTGVLSKSPPDHVVICQPNNDHVALMGELSAEALKLKGVLGYIADGGMRDCQFILDMDFPVWGRFRTPEDIVARWLPTAFNETIKIGNVAISGGDWVLADRDGIVILPQGHAEEIVQETERVVGLENTVRTAILAGMDPQEAYLKHRKF